jgi:alkylation response protein AidB-like acyl-CoA dehydrogenase
MISFELSEEQQMIRDTVGAFAREQIRPAARPADEQGTIPRELIVKARQLGLIRSAIPQQFGGDGDTRSAVTGAVIAEELAYGDLSIAIDVLAPRLFAFPLMEMGTIEQQKRYLPRVVRSESVAASAAVMEPKFDLDLAALSTVAKRQGSGFAIDGSKCFVPLAAEAEFLLVYACSDPKAGLSGVDAFIVERGAPGLAICEREKNMGIKGLATYEITVKDCRLAPEARLGGERGCNFTRLTGQWRVAMAAMAIGVARASFEYARDYAKERKAFGVPIATKQAIAFMLADMAIEIDASRLLVWEAAWHLDKGEDGLKESYLARNYAAAAALKIADNAVQSLGGHGYIREHPVEMWLRNARGFATFEGLATV